MAMTPKTACAASSTKARMVWPRSPRGHQRKTEQDRKQQHLQDFAGRESADHRVRNDMQEEIDRLLGFRLLGKTSHFARVGQRTAETAARPDHITDDKSDHQCEG
jgi:hypothetical protein